MRLKGPTSTIDEEGAEILRRKSRLAPNSATMDPVSKSRYDCESESLIRYARRASSFSDLIGLISGWLDASDERNR